MWSAFLWGIVVALAYGLLKFIEWDSRRCHRKNCPFCADDKERNQ